MESDMREDPSDLLRQLTDDRHRLADRLRVPWWLPAGFGALAAAFVATPLLPRGTGFLATAAVAVLLLLSGYRRRTGVRLSLLPRAGGATYWLTGLVVLMLLSTSFALVSLDLRRWVMVPVVAAFGAVAWATTRVVTTAAERTRHGR